VSLSLNAWTSSNGHVFLAIVMHCINDDWKLGTPFFKYWIPVCSTILIISEELLVDFHELVREHSVRIWPMPSMILSTSMVSRVGYVFELFLVRYTNIDYS